MLTAEDVPPVVVFLEESSGMGAPLVPAAEAAGCVSDAEEAAELDASEAELLFEEGVLFEGVVFEVSLLACRLQPDKITAKVAAVSKWSLDFMVWY